MTGVEILSSETIYNTFIFESLNFISMILGIGFLMIFLLLFIACPDDSIITDMFGVLGVICITLCVFGSFTNTNSIDYIEYKVIIEDSVPMNEFLNKYEILDQEGKIYTVKEIN